MESRRAHPHVRGLAHVGTIRREGEGDKGEGRACKLEKE
jgi:hypothetical protein